tara:strand:- start:16371 stop:16478 length:108 start_codon:yes stop_codon:yes gene_type:complete
MKSIKIYKIELKVMKLVNAIAIKPSQKLQPPKTKE